MAFSQNDQGFLLCDLNVYLMFGFWAIILAQDMLESQSDSKDSEDSLDSIKTSQK